jgi:spermidine/putrescine transport system permease protein
MAINNTTRIHRKRWLPALLGGPAALYLLLFFLLPFVVIIVYSFLTRSPTGGVLWVFTFDNYARLFSDPIYGQIFWRSIWMGLATTLICLLIGYPLALFIVRRNRRRRTILILLILIPFWTNLLVRTYAWMVILGNNGLINNLIGWFGFEPITMLNTGGAVLLGLVYTGLPFMVLPLFASIDRFDFRLLEAASDLGATRRQAFLRIMLPLTMPGIVAGSVLVFIPAAGNYIVPALLGGNKVTLVGNLLEQQFGSAQNKPLGSAAAILVMIVLTLAVVLYFRVTSEEDR